MAKAGKRRTRLEKTAYHEAGHAVAAAHCEHATGIRRIAIPKDGDALQHVTPYFQPSFKPGIRVGIMLEAKIQDDIIVFLAGNAAEKKLTHRSNRKGCEGDYRAAAYYAELVARSERTRAKYIAYCAAAADDLVEDFWHEIEAVAQALLQKKKLTSRAVSGILSEAKP